jgi:esterase/lipase superfamily enzyme
VSRYEIVLHSLAVGDQRILRYGHYGRPLLWFASDQGWAHDFENNGLLEAIGPLVDAGRTKVYCLDSYDAQSWRRNDLPLEERARLHQKFDDFVLYDVVPAIYADCQGRQDIIVSGCSFGAYHAANFTLRRADLFPLAICLSGMYDLGRIGWGERGNATYFNNPVDYVSHMHGDHLNWIRSRVYVLLVCGQGAWEDDSASGSLSATKQFAAVLADKGIPHELDLWGYDVAHDWPWWRKQLAHHLPRFV